MNISQPKPVGKLSLQFTPRYLNLKCLLKIDNLVTLLCKLKVDFLDCVMSIMVINLTNLLSNHIWDCNSLPSTYILRFTKFFNVLR